MTFNNAAFVEHTQLVYRLVYILYINKVAESANIPNNKGAYFCGIV